MTLLVEVTERTSVPSVTRIVSRASPRSPRAVETGTGPTPSISHLSSDCVPPRTKEAASTVTTSSAEPGSDAAPLPVTRAASASARAWSTETCRPRAHARRQHWSVALPRALMTAAPSPVGSNASKRTPPSGSAPTRQNRRATRRRSRSRAASSPRSAATFADAAARSPAREQRWASRMSSEATPGTLVAVSEMTAA